jgi:hypothetical protein
LPSPPLSPHPLIPFSWFSYVFTYEGPNRALLGFYNAIELVMETGFALTAFVNVILNLILPEEIEDEEIPELTANDADDTADKEEWNKIKHANGKDMSDEEAGPAGTASKVQ